MKAIKTIVSIQSINNITVSKSILEFYTFEQPSKKYIANKVCEKLNIELQEKNCSTFEGGDYGAFFFYGDMYITYSFSDIVIE
jgi:hypothetical protein